MFAYLDRGGILHVVSTRETAEDYAEFNGKIVETELSDGTGYPKENDKRIVVYAKEKEFYEGGNAGHGRLMDEVTFRGKYPQTYKLYTDLI